MKILCADRRLKNTTVAEIREAEPKQDCAILVKIIVQEALPK